ncbi:hypothetical protein PGRAN_07603 [Listeria grandensis FSL F6-0971]|uniref:Uncharacterized protein n=2 Tax=Listeria grandensis TaxID=1494963 RepID=W7BT29_9LIST|nr:hypothetical protein PGRAN_07603 [Listeria grandensis FSL F6-0971]
MKLTESKKVKILLWILGSNFFTGILAPDEVSDVYLASNLVILVTLIVLEWRYKRKNRKESSETWGEQQQR